MSQTATIHEEAWRVLRDKLVHPSTLLLLATNAVPLLGVLFWHWDAFLMLLLYWAETAIIGFWAFAAYLFRPGYDKDDRGRTGLRAAIGRLMQMAFLCLHAGLFMGGHLFILRDIFPDSWPQGVHSVSGFIDQVFVANWLWVPLAAMFLYRGAVYLSTRIDPQALRRSWPRLAMAMGLNGEARAPTQAQMREATTGVVRFYGRVILMQVALLVGGFLAIGFGNATPAILLIVVKTTIDLLLHVGEVKVAR